MNDLKQGNVSVYLFGAPRIVQDNTQIAVDTRKATALLAFLAVTEVPASRESLIALLYPELDQTHARAALRRTISALKQAVGPSRLVVSGETLFLGDLWIDVREFSQQLYFWKNHRHTAGCWCEECLARLEKSVLIYTADFLAGFTLRDSINFDDWQYFTTESYKKDLMAAFSQLVPWLIETKKYDRAIEYGRRWLSLDIINEEAHRSLMRCYAWSGQRGAALRQYRECVRILDHELGVTPVEETTQLYREIMEHRMPAQPGIYHSSMPSSPPTVQPGAGISQLKPGDAPLVGRSQELDELRWAYQWSATRGCFFLIEGEMGIGKSRLAREFLDSIGNIGRPILAARCFEGETQLAYAPFIEALQSVYLKPGASELLKELPEPWASQVALLIPEFAQGNREGLSRQGTPLLNQSIFFESLRRIVLNLTAGNPPVVIFLDDLQWADTASLDFLAYLVRRLDIQPIFILCTWRNEASTTDQRIQNMLADAQRYGTGKILHLGRLNLDHIHRLVEAVIGQKDISFSEISRRLFEETEGVPYLAVEYLNQMVADKTRVAGYGEKPDQWILPLNVRDALLARLKMTGEIGWQLLTTGAVLGRSFDYQNLLEASGRTDSETVNGLEELIQRQIIKEIGASSQHGEVTYDFSHEKIRQLIYEQTSISRRRLLHRRVAEILVSHGRGNRTGSASASAIAQHFELSGELERAAEYYRLAGLSASSVFAHREAVANFQAALTFGHPHESELHEAIGDSLAMLGDYRAASDSYDAGIAFCLPEEVPRFELKLGNIHHRLGNYELAIRYFESSAIALELEKDPAMLARVYADWSRSTFFIEKPAKARQLASQALAQAVKAGDPRAIAQVHNILGILARHTEDFVTAETELKESLNLANQINEPGLTLAALNNLALLNVSMGNLRDAEMNFETALEQCERLGDRHLEAALHNNLADVLHTQGNTEDAMEELKKAVLIFSEIGVHEGEIVPEVWKLTEW